MANTTMTLLNPPINLHYGGPFRQEPQKTATANIKPGMVIYKNAAGTVTESQSDGTPPDGQAYAIAGVMNGHDWDTAYASGDVIPCILWTPGCIVAMFIDDPGAGTELAGQSLIVGTNAGSMLIDDTEATNSKAVLYKDVADNDTICVARMH